MEKSPFMAIALVVVLAISLQPFGKTVYAQPPAKLPAFSAADVFELEYASDPQISPSGKTVVYVRRGYDVLTDGSVARLWEVDVNTGTQRKLTDNERNEGNPSWSPTGDRLAFTLSTDQGSELYVRWTATGQIARLATLPNSPQGVKWSPDGKQLAFSMHVDAKEKDADFALKMPAKPEGAKWAETARVTTRLRHELDGRGYLDPGFRQLFVLPADGGTPRQLTGGEYDHGSDFAWLPDGKAIIVNSNHRTDREIEMRDNDLFKVSLADTSIVQLTDNYGPDEGVAVSPNGNQIAYVSHTNINRAYTRDQLKIMTLSDGKVKNIASDWDTSPSDLQWSSDGLSIYALYDERGYKKLAKINASTGKRVEITKDLGGTTLGRPYTSGSYSVSTDGIIAYTHGEAHRPSDVAVVLPKGEQKKLTGLNEDLLAYRALGEVKEVNYASVPMKYGADTTSPVLIQGWVVFPPNYDASRKYPMLVENHGGPILAYGPQFTAEIQLYAAHDYLVFYPNQRGSTGYGEAFSDELYRAYPDRDYDDVMAGVDHLIEQGWAHADSLYVTGGSAGGIMSAWIIGKTDRFRAAVVSKPVMNWISKTLVADNYFSYANSRYEGQPFENPMHYWSFSPISLVGNVTTPTAVIVGMNDLRTPPSEAKQLYHALKLRGIPTALIEFPGAGHGLANRPSQLIQKVNFTLGWFEKYR